MRAQRRGPVGMLLMVLSGCLLAGANPAVRPVLNERWADGERVTQRLPDSAAWFTSQAAPNLTAERGAMRQRLGESGMVVTYFTEPGRPLQLQVGETLRLAYSISFEGTIGSAYFRIGLFDTSRRARIDADAIGSSNSSFIGARGYMLNLSGLQAGDSVDLRRRQPQHDSGVLMNSTRPYWTATGSQASLSRAVQAGVQYTGLFEVTRTATSAVEVSASLIAPGGETVFEMTGVRDESVTTHAAFDTIAFVSHPDNADAFTLHIVQVGVLEKEPGAAAAPPAAAPAVASAPTARVAAAPTTRVPMAPARDLPLVAPVDWSRISLEMFSDEELKQMYGNYLPYYLNHLATMANSVDSEGWITHRGWRGADEDKRRNPRILENVLSFIFFYTRERPWNPYYGDEALRARIEQVLRRYLAYVPENGLMISTDPIREHVGMQLANGMFFTKFMAEALVMLEDGPPIDEQLHDELKDAQRRILMHILTSDLAELQGRQFSNQYGNIFSGAYAYLTLYDDPELEKLFNRAIRDVVPTFQSPAGYLYENHSTDFGYTTGTHHSNVHGAYEYALRGKRDTGWLDKETALWAEWLAYNTVPTADYSAFYVNRAIEGRQNFWGFDRVNAPFAREIPALRPFVTSAEEHQAETATVRRSLADSWGTFGRLGTGFTTYAPYAFLHFDHYSWYPAEAERAQHRRALPYVARDRFVHQRVDNRRPLEVTFIRRPGYYAVFNAGEGMSGVQTFGLGLLWHPEAGVAIQTQTRMKDAAWGTLIGSADVVVESASPFDVEYHLDGRRVLPEAGARDLDDGAFEIHYRLTGRDEKFLRFEDDRILVAVNPGGAFVEQIPVLVDRIEDVVVSGSEARVRSGNRTLVIRAEGENALSAVPTDRTVGEKQVAVVRIEGFRRCIYTLQFD